jgi:transcriptional regulator with XRE-family HTH domain
MLPDLTARQLRAARSFLGLGQKDVSEATGIGTMTISNIENESVTPKASTLGALKSFYETSGVEFTADGGIRESKAEIVRYEGQDGFKAFMDDVFETIKAKPGTYYVSNVNEDNWLRWLGEEDAKRRRGRTTALEGVNAKILVKSGDNLMTATDYAEYRAVPDSMYMENLSHYIYGDKLALIEFKEDSVQVLVLRNAEFTAAQRIWFEAIWNLAEKA